jgi:hypothetical protein
MADDRWRAPEQRRPGPEGSDQQGFALDVGKCRERDLGVGEGLLDEKAVEVGVVSGEDHVAAIVHIRPREEAERSDTEHREGERDNLDTGDVQGQRSVIGDRPAGVRCDLSGQGPLDRLWIGEPVPLLHRLDEVPAHEFAEAAGIHVYVLEGPRHLGRQDRLEGRFEIRPLLEEFADLAGGRHLVGTAWGSR